MVTINTFVDRLSGLEYYAKKIATEMLFKIGQSLVQLNNAELLKGQNTQGKFIQRGYSKPYARRRRKKGLQTEFVDLYFTGKFQNTSKPVKVVEGLDINSDAYYEKYLRAKYEDIRGLNEEQAEKTAEKISNELAKELKKYLVG